MLGTNKKTARIAGALYLAYIVASLLAAQFGRYHFNEAAVVVSHLAADPMGLRIGFVIEMFGAVFFLLAAWTLYVLLKSVERNLALLFLLLNLGGVAIQCASMLHLWSGLLMLDGADYRKVFSPEQLQAQATACVAAYKSGYILAQVFYGAWVLPLGWLVFKSGFLPRIFGILLMADCAAILVWFLQFFLFPGFAAIATVCCAISAIAEFSLTFWLLTRGIRETPKASAAPAASGRP